MKHISTKTIAGLAAFLLFMPACTNELNETPASEQAIVFGPQADTRAVVENTGELGSFSVWGWYTKTTPVQIFGDENGGTTVESPNWTYEGGARYWVPGATYNFYGVYPNTVDAQVSNGVITVPSFDCSTTGNDAVDLMTAFATGDGDNPEKVGMNFGHELARVSIVIRSRFADAVLSQASLYGMAVKGQLSATEASSSWKVESLVTNESTPYKFNGQLTIEEGKELSLWEDLLIIPQALNDLKLKVQYTNDGGTLQEPEISLVTSTLQEWVAGKSYRYTLTIEPDGILFENLTADAWGETSSGGSIIIH